MSEHGISVIICCYNSAPRLPETLHHLATQKCEHLSWEIIIVNNNSTDDTKEVAKLEWTKRGLSNITLKIVDEPLPGLNNARERGVRESKFDYIIFCDDDNWLSENYLSAVWSIFESNKNIGVIGTDSYGFYDGEAPQWFIDNHGYFAIGQYGNDEDVTETRGKVWGAGMAIRKNKLFELRAKGYQMMSADRKGAKMSTGGDSELCLALKAIGCKIYYTNKCSITHYMSINRYDVNKFYELMFQNGYIDMYLECIDQKRLHSTTELVKILSNSFKELSKRTIAKKIRYKTFDINREKEWWLLRGRIKGALFLITNYRTVRRNLKKLV